MKQQIGFSNTTKRVAITKQHQPVESPARTGSERLASTDASSKKAYRHRILNDDGVPFRQTNPTTTQSLSSSVSIRRQKRSFIHRMRASKRESTPEVLSAPRKKLVVVGDGHVGKTCLLTKFAKKFFPETYVPTVFETLITDINVDDRRVELALWDTAGQEDYDRLRPVSYHDTDVILLCFAIDQRDSFHNITTKWLPEVQHYCPEVPFVLVAMKADLRQDTATLDKLKSEDETMVSDVEGRTLCTSIGACNYLECSAKTGENVDDVFQAVAKTELTSQRKMGKVRNKKPCVIM